MKKGFAVAVLAVAVLAAPAPALAKHDAKKPLVVALKKKATTLTTALANQGMKTRLSKVGGFKIKKFKSKCTKLSASSRRCTYKMQDAFGAALGTSYCSSKRGTTVKLIRRGKALSVGPTPTKSC